VEEGTVEYAVDRLWIVVAVLHVALISVALFRLRRMNIAMRAIRRLDLARGEEVTIAGAPGTTVALGPGTEGWSWQIRSNDFTLEAGGGRRIRVPEGVAIDLRMTDVVVEQGEVVVPAGTRFLAIIDGAEHAEHGPLRTGDALTLDASVRLYPMERRRQLRLDDELSVVRVGALLGVVAAIAVVGSRSVMFAAVAGGLFAVLLAWDLLMSDSFVVGLCCERAPDPSKP
jgi:hypothetical protein